MKKNILVVGSSNTDMVVQAHHLPAPGETILGGRFLMNAGGKGANQAVAAARLGGQVRFICKRGDDIFGREAVELFQREGIDTQGILLDKEQPSGVALITVDRHAENCIVVASGANGTLSAADLEGSEKAIGDSAIVLMQLEIPVDTVDWVAGQARSQGARVILNPAPACPLPNSLWSRIDIITPNEKEASLLSGIEVKDMESAQRAAKRLGELGVPTVIITLGSQGALVWDGKEFTTVPAVKVDPVDTTAAGDVFNGALATALSMGEELVEAARFACRAAALSVTRLGAQSSAPYRRELEGSI